MAFAAIPSPERATDLTGPTRPRRCRVLSFLVISALVLGVYLLVAVASVIDMEEPFDVKNALTLQVSGCDVRVLRGASPTVRLSRYLSGGGSHRWTYNAAGTGVTRLQVEAKGCDGMPDLRCRELCQVTVTAPTGADAPSYLQVLQANDDESPVVRLDVEDGVELGKLELKMGFARAGEWAGPRAPPLCAGSALNRRL